MLENRVKRAVVKPLCALAYTAYSLHLQGLGVYELMIRLGKLPWMQDTKH
jgi:hypothetical protein